MPTRSHQDSWRHFFLVSRGLVMHKTRSKCISRNYTPTSTRWRSSALPTRPLLMKRRQPRQHLTRRPSGVGGNARGPSWSTGPSGRAAPAGCRRRASGRSPLRMVLLLPARRRRRQPWLPSAAAGAICTRLRSRSAVVAPMRLICNCLSPVVQINAATRLADDLDTPCHSSHPAR